MVDAPTGHGDDVIHGRLVAFRRNQNPAGVVLEQVAVDLLRVGQRGERRTRSVSRSLPIDGREREIERLRETYASNGSALVDLLHHVLLSPDPAVLGHVVLGVLVLGHGPAVVPDGGRGGRAVPALVDGVALLVLGLVELAALLGDAKVVDKLVDSLCVSAVAAAGDLGPAVEDDLNGEVDVGPGALSEDLDAVRETAEGAVSPARSAVLRD